MHRQGPILVLTLVAWALMPELTVWSLVLAYALAWALVNVLSIARPSLFGLSGLQRLGIGAVMVAFPLVSIASRFETLLDTEGLTGSAESAEDRWRLEDTPSIFPAVVFFDHPQTFYVHAPAAGTVLFRASESADPAAGTSLGHGLFRIAYDPALHGPPAADGPIEVALEIDGATHLRPAVGVQPRPHPRWLHGSADRRLAATVSEETDELIVVEKGGLVARIDVGDAPTDCAFVDDRRVAVAHRHTDMLFVVDVLSETILARIPLSAHQVRVASAPATGTLAVAVHGPEPGVFLVDVEAGSVRDFLPIDADWLAFARDGRTLLVSSTKRATLERFDLSPPPVGRQTLLLGRPAVTLAVAPDGSHAMIATTDYRADGSTHYGNHFVQDQLLTIDVPSFTVVDQELTARRSSRQASGGDVDRGGSPMGIELGFGGWARIAFAGTWEVWTLGLGPRPEIIDTPELSAPHSTFTFEGGSFAVTSPADGSIGLFDPSGTLEELIRLAPDDEALLEESEHALARRMGERTFYESTRSGIACQSCHLHADTDHVMRNIGEHRLSPTLSVRGVAGTAPYLRDGSYPRIRDLEHLSRTLLRGFLRRAPGRAHTLEAFVEALPSNPSLGVHAERDLPRERRGLDVFVRAGCPTCHALPAFTNLGQHPLGSLFPGRAAALGADAILDVPSLIGVSRGGPFLTDGRAEDLTAVIHDRDAANRHGDTENLSDAEVADLVYFLEML